MLLLKLFENLHWRKSVGEEYVLADGEKVHNIYSATEAGVTLEIAHRKGGFAVVKLTKQGHHRNEYEDCRARAQLCEGDVILNVLEAEHEFRPRFTEDRLEVQLQGRLSQKLLTKGMQEWATQVGSSFTLRSWDELKVRRLEQRSLHLPVPVHSWNLENVADKERSIDMIPLFLQILRRCSSRTATMCCFVASRYSTASSTTFLCPAARQTTSV